MNFREPSLGIELHAGIDQRAVYVDKTAVRPRVCDTYMFPVRPGNAHLQVLHMRCAAGWAESEETPRRPGSTSTSWSCGDCCGSSMMAACSMCGRAKGSSSVPGSGTVRHARTCGCGVHRRQPPGLPEGGRPPGPGIIGKR